MKKVYTTIFCLGIVAITVLLLLVFLLKPEKNNLELKTNDLIKGDKEYISVCIGKKIEDYYELNDLNAEISFEVDKQGVIFINKDYIEGLRVGEVKVKMMAKTNTLTTTIEFVVKVYNDVYQVNFIHVENCRFEDDSIIATSKIFQFRFEVYNGLNDLITSVQYDIVSSSTSMQFEKGLNSTVIISVEEECTISFIFEDLSINLNKNIILDI